MSVAIASNSLIRPPAVASVKSPAAAAPSVSWTTPSGSLGTIVAGQTVDLPGLGATSQDGGAVTYSVVAGKLPAGLTLNSATGVISGTAAAAGNAGFTIRAVNSRGIATNRAFTLTTKPGPSPAAVKSSAAVAGASLIAAQSASVPSQTAATTPPSAQALPNAVNLVVYDNISLQAGAPGLTGTPTFSATGLPQGLSIDSSGLITGTVLVQENQSYVAMVGAKDDQGNIYYAPVTFHVLAHHYPGWNNAGTVVNRSRVA